MDQIDKLMYREVKPKVTSKKALVILHGYGADSQDLYPLASVLDPSRQWHWFFLEGPKSVPPFGGRAWFPIDEEKLQEAMMQGKHRNYREIEPPGMHEALDFLKKPLGKLISPFEEVILGGFSQGAMMAHRLALQFHPQKVILLSGAFVHEESLQKIHDSSYKPEFFQSHGKRDPLLSFSEAQALHSFLLEHGWRGDFFEFEGGHEIPQHILEKLKSFLNS